MDIIKITDSISLIPAKNNGRFPFSHSFLIRGTSTALIDTGCGIEKLKSVKNNFPVDFLINSHCHPDHSAGNWIFPDTPLHVPFQSETTHGRLGPLSERLTEPGPLAEKWIQYVTGALEYGEKNPVNFFKEGDIFNFGETRIIAIHTPGHTEDHHCFYEPDSGILFSFDLDLTSFGPFYGHRESDIGLLRKSIRRIRDLNPKIIVSSHREIIKDGIQDEIDKFEKILDQRENKIFSMLNRGMSFPDILDSSPFYGKYPYAPELMRYWEGQMIIKHFEEMKTKGLIPEINGKCQVTYSLLHNN